MPFVVWLVLAAASNPTDDAFERASKHYRRGEFNKALDTLSGAEDARSKFLLGAVLFSLHDEVGMERAFRDALDLDPWFSAPATAAPRVVEVFAQIAAVARPQPKLAHDVPAGDEALVVSAAPLREDDVVCVVWTRDGVTERVPMERAGDGLFRTPAPSRERRVDYHFVVVDVRGREIATLRANAPFVRLAVAASLPVATSLPIAAPAAVAWYQRPWPWVIGGVIVAGVAAGIAAGVASNRYGSARFSVTGVP